NHDAGACLHGRVDKLAAIHRLARHGNEGIARTYTAAVQRQAGNAARRHGDWQRLVRQQLRQGYVHVRPPCASPPAIMPGLASGAIFSERNTPSMMRENTGAATWPP